MDTILKTGVSSIVLGSFYFKNFINNKEDKLLKLTNINSTHNELKYLKNIRKIKDYEKYYVIPDEELFYIKPSNNYYKFVKQLVDEETQRIFNGIINCYFINYAGDQDIYETINFLAKNNFTVWSSYKKIYQFSHKILLGLSYLHQNKICHLDIKPENIIYNSKTKDFRIIDFGFCSMEPFDDFVINIRGTPGYMPKYFPEEKVTKYLPKVDANDFIYQNNTMPILLNRKLVYKIDSYCFGRVLYSLKNIYRDFKVYGCRNTEKIREKKLDKIISSLIENDVYKRKTVQECLDLYF